MDWSPYNVCEYLNEDRSCSIYSERPFVCREFSCRDKVVLFRAIRSVGSIENPFNVVMDKNRIKDINKMMFAKDGPSIEGMGIIWTMLGDFRNYENELADYIETLSDDSLKNKLRLIINNMVASVENIESEYIRHQSVVRAANSIEQILGDDEDGEKKS